MKIFLDTNVLVDLLDNSRKNFLEAATIFEAAKEGILDVCLSSQSITNCAYIARKKPAGVYRAAISRIMPFVDIVPVTKEQIAKAVSSACPDFEEAALIACAEDNLCDIILTANVSHFKPFTILNVQSPEEFVGKVR